MVEGMEASDTMLPGAIPKQAQAQLQRRASLFNARALRGNPMHYNYVHPTNEWQTTLAVVHHEPPVELADCHVSTKFMTWSRCSPMQLQKTAAL